MKALETLDQRPSDFKLGRTDRWNQNLQRPAPSMEMVECPVGSCMIKYALGRSLTGLQFWNWPLSDPHVLEIVWERQENQIPNCVSLAWGLIGWCVGCHSVWHYPVTVCDSLHWACSALVIELRLVPKVLGSSPAFSTKHVTCLLHVGSS
jgi:hypothetical protein